MVILLDRDGIINDVSPQYIKSVHEFRFLPGSLEALVRLTAAGYRVGIATNQSGIARGYFDEQTLLAIHEKMYKAVRAAGGDIAAIEYCPHLPESGCLCRKPNPGMLYALAERFNCDLSRVPFVGDNISDIQAAEAAQAKPILVSAPGSEVEIMCRGLYPQVPIYNTLAQFVDAYVSTSLTK